MAKARRSDFEDWNVDEQQQRQKELQRELVEKLKRRQAAGESLMSQQEIDRFKGRPMTEEEMNELKKQFTEIYMTNKINNNIQANRNTTTWTENKRWMVALISVLGLIAVIGTLAVYDILVQVFISIVLLLVFGWTLVAAKDIVDEILDR